MAELTYTVNNNIASFHSADKTNIKNLKFYFFPIQEGSGIPSPYNVRNITGWNGLQAYYCGKNLFDINTLNMTDGTYTVTVENGIASGQMQSFQKLTAPSSNRQLYPSFPIDNTRAITFKITAYTDNNQNLDTRGMCLAVKCVGESAQYAWFDNIDTSPTTKILTVPAGKTLDCFYISYSNGYRNIWYITELQIEYADEATTYEAYHCNSYPIIFPDNNIIYGGYIDLISGELVQTKHSINPLECTFYLNGDYTDTYGIYISQNLSNTIFKPAAHSAISNRFSLSVDTSQIGGLDNYSAFYFGLPKNELETVDIAGAQKWFEDHPTTIIYDLETPIIHQLTSQQLKTLRGQNNIWSNANGNTEVTYEFTDKLLKKSFSLYNPDFIPPAYKKYDYIQTVGTASWFDTGIAGNDNTIEIDFTIMALGKGSYSGGILGNHDTEQLKCWRFIQGAATNYNGYCITLNNRRAGSSSTASVTAIDSIINKKIKAHMEYGTAYLEYNDIKYYITPANDTYDTSTLNIAIGINGPTKSSSTTVVSHRFYDSLKIRKGGKLIRNYFPVVRKLDGKVGFFDTVNGTFNVSAGPAEFRVGTDANKEIQLPNGYTRIARLIQNGDTISSQHTSYINLRRVFDSTHRYKFIANFNNTYNERANFFFFGAREQESYTPKNTGFTYAASDPPSLIFYGINDGIVQPSYSTTIKVANTYTEDQEIEVKVIDGLLTCLNSEGLQTAVPNGAMKKEAFQSESQIYLGAINYHDIPKYRMAIGSSIVLYEEYDEHDILITKFIPCVRNLDNVAGMYDIITNTFWPSDNPDYPFIAGYDI